MWAHDHRFFFTAENVYKGNLGMVNYYSGRDRGNEALTDGINLRLPSGTAARLGQHRFRRQPRSSPMRATDPDGQLFFDIFTTDGFLGDMPLVNFAYAPFFEVLPRKYRFRILNACMSRFFKLALSRNGSAVPFKFIANDGNLVVNPITLTALDEQGIAERYDIVVDFSQFRRRRQALPRQPADDARRRPRAGTGAVARAGAGGRSSRSGASARSWSSGS